MLGYTGECWCLENLQFFRVPVPMITHPCYDRGPQVGRDPPMTYACPDKDCGRTFPQSSGLSLHISRGHPKESFSTVLGKRKQQIEHEEGRKRQFVLQQENVEAGPSALPVLLFIL